MTPIVRHVSYALLVAAGLALAATAAFHFGYISVAHAQGEPDAGAGSGSAVTPLPDPLEQPGEAISTVTKLWRSGAITSALIVAAFLVLTVLRAKVKWLSVGYRAAVMAALVGGLGTLADAIQRGTSPNLSMLVVAVTTALAMFLAPKPKDAPA